MKLYILGCILFISIKLFSQDFIQQNASAGAFPIAANNISTNIVTDKNDDWLVQKSAYFLQADIEKVTNNKLQISNNFIEAKNTIIVGTPKSSFIKQLIKDKKINIADIENKWEAYKIVVINNPFKNIGKALVIIGSDKRGTSYGVFELSKQMGVSSSLA